MKIWLGLSLMGLVGCSSIQKTVLRTTTPIFVEGSNQLGLEGNWEFLKASMPANIKLFEMLYLQDRENTELLGSLVKGYAGYAYAILETEAFGDDLIGVEESVHRKNAIAMYTRSLDYGLDYLQMKGIRKTDLLNLDESDLLKLLKKNLSKQDHRALLFTAQSWGSLINLQKHNVVLISHVPKVKVLFDFVCGREVSIENGVCDLYFAQYEASRPRMLGGNPEKAKSLYEAAIKARPLSLLARVSYIQFSILPGYDKEAYEVQARVLREEFKKFEDLNRDSLEDKSEYKAEEQLNLYNATAKKRFDYLEKNKHKIFEG